VNLGDRVVVTRGGFRGKTATIVEGYKIGMSLCVGDAVADTFTYDAAKSWPKQIFIKFDDPNIKGGEWGTGIFRFTKQKLKPLDG
jgi:hypothetical protein